MITASLAMLMAANPLPPPIALAPDGAWVVEGENNMCALLHAYGTGKARVTVAIRPWPLDEQTDILVFEKGGNEVERGIATFVIDAATEPIIGDYFSYGLKGGDQRLTTMTVASHTIDTLDRATSLSIRIGKHAPFVILPPAGSKAFDALKGCEKMLLESLHVDPEANARVTTPAKAIGEKANWFKSSDYPPIALGGSQQGSTRILLTIGINGRIAGCTSFGTAGSMEMDKAACSIITQRGRFMPARDKAGGAVVSYQTETIRWTIG